MRAETQHALIDEVLAHARVQGTAMAETTLRIPASHYTSEDHAEAERVRWFGAQPHLAALSGELPEAGDFIAYESAGLPIVLVRSPDGRARAFENICRHRAAPVARGRGHAPRVFTCPFHGWSYDTGSGQVRAQPKSCDGFAGEETSALGLTPLACEERHGLILVDPRRESSRIDHAGWLEGLDGEIESNEYGSYVPFRSRVDRWPCNWKLLLDTFFESYHVFSLHRESLASDYLGIASSVHGFGPHNRLVVPMKSILDLESKPRDDRALHPHAVVQYFIAPDIILSHYHGVLAMTRFAPLSAAETEVTQALLTPGPVESESERAGHERRFEFAHAITADEDYPESVRVHRNLATGRVDHTTIGRNEAGVILFHRAIERCLRSISPQSDSGALAPKA